MAKLSSIHIDTSKAIEELRRALSDPTVTITPEYLAELIDITDENGNQLMALGGIDLGFLTVKRCYSCLKDTRHISNICGECGHEGEL